MKKKCFFTENLGKHIKFCPMQPTGQIPYWQNKDSYSNARGQQNSSGIYLHWLLLPVLFWKAGRWRPLSAHSVLKHVSEIQDLVHGREKTLVLLIWLNSVERDLSGKKFDSLNILGLVELMYCSTTSPSLSVWKWVSSTQTECWRQKKFRFWSNLDLKQHQNMYHPFKHSPHGLVGWALKLMGATNTCGKFKLKSSCGK